MTASAEPTTVYLITSGEYSGYHVDWVTLDKSVAESMVSRDRALRIEEHELITVAPRRGENLCLSGTVDRLGVLYESEWSEIEWDGDHSAPCTDSSRPVVGRFQFDSDNRRPEYYVQVSGTDVERVRKVYSERKAKALAELMEL